MISKYVAITEAIATARTGIATHNLEPEKWARGITIPALQNSAAVAEMSTAARRLASDRHSWEQAVRQFQHCYRSIPDRSTASP